MRTTDPKGVDLISRMLVYDPQKRISAKVIILHGTCDLRGGEPPLVKGLGWLVYVWSVIMMKVVAMALPKCCL